MLGGQVAQGYVWVWGDCGTSAAAESALTPPVLIPELQPDDTGQATDGGPVISAASRYARDLPYRCDCISYRRVERKVGLKNFVFSVLSRRCRERPVWTVSGGWLLGKGS